jgi:hypothetical protein
MSERDELEFIERIAAPLRDPEALHPTFDARLHAAVRAAAARGEAPRRSTRHWRWLTTTRPVPVSPLLGLAAAAGFAVVVAGATVALSAARPSQRSAAEAIAGAAPEAPPQVVRFVIAAPAAHRVSLVGDFNGWDAAATPLAREASGGTWTVTVPLTAGSYQYAFVVDGKAWLADPAAAVALEDEFGAPSSIVTVPRASS